MEDWLSHRKPFFLYFSIAISVPSTCLYCVEIYTILRHNKFHNSFYALFVIRASTDLLYTLTSYAGYRVPNLFPEQTLQMQLPNWVPATTIFMAAYTLPADNLATSFILLNRLTAIAWPLRHENIWRKLLPLAMLAIYGLPLNQVGLLRMQATFVAEKDTQGNVLAVDIVEKPEVAEPIYGFYLSIGTLCAIAFLVISTLLNLAVLAVYRKQSKSGNNKNNNGSSNSNQRIERKLLSFAVLTFLGHMLIAVVLIGIYIAATGQNAFLFALLTSQYSWICDLGMVVLPSWLLPWASPSFRRQMLADLLPKAVHDRIGGGTQKASTAVRVTRLVNGVRPSTNMNS